MNDYTKNNKDEVLFIYFDTYFSSGKIIMNIFIQFLKVRNVSGLIPT